MKSMPDAPVRVGVPTTLARDLIQRVVAGFVDQVTLELKNLKVKKSGKVKKVVTLGQYDLKVDIHRVTGKLKTGKPEVTFGGDKVALALPVTVASGTGRATIHFKWDGKSAAGATCGDLEVTQEVSGGVRPDTYPVAGGLVLTATAKDILAQPRFPLIKVNLKVLPSEESWAAVDKILDEKDGPLRLRRREGQRPGHRPEARRQGLQRAPAHREDQADGGAGRHRADHGGAGPAGRPRDQGGRPRHHRGRDLARGAGLRGGGRGGGEADRGEEGGGEGREEGAGSRRRPPEGPRRRSRRPESRRRARPAATARCRAVRLASSSSTAATAGSTAAATAGVISCRNSSTLSASIATMRTSDGIG